MITLEINPNTLDTAEMILELLKENTEWQKHKEELETAIWEYNWDNSGGPDCFD